MSLPAHPDCIGTPQHLRSKFGSHFTVIGRVGFGATAVADFQTRLREGIPRFDTVEVQDHMVRIHVPRSQCVGGPTTTRGGGREDDVITMAHIFRTLEACKQGGVVTAYSVAEANLEEIFLDLSQRKRLAYTSQQH